MATLHILESANLFVGDHDPTQKNFLSLQSIKLPTMEENMVSHAAGGGPVEVEIATHVNRLECGFNLAGWDPKIMELIGDWRPNRRRHTIYGAMRNQKTGDLEDATAVIEGRISRADPSEFRKGDLQGFAYTIRSIFHYELRLDGREIYFFDFWTNARRANGVDLNRELNRILRIPAAS